MIFLILHGADLMKSTLDLKQAPNQLAPLVRTSGLSPFVVMLAILLLYMMPAGRHGRAFDAASDDSDLLPQW